MGHEIDAQLRGVMDSGVPAVLVSCSKDGTPNATLISQVYPVDADHVALSFQFFNKTIKNVRENPRVNVTLIDYMGGAYYRMDLRYDHSEDSGDIFDQMEMQLEAIASATGMSGVFKLRAADVYEVLAYERLPVQGG